MAVETADALVLCGLGGLICPNGVHRNVDTTFGGLEYDEFASNKAKTSGLGIRERCRTIRDRISWWRVEGLGDFLPRSLTDLLTPERTQ